MGSFCTGEMYLNPGAKGTFYLSGSHAEGWKPACGVQSYEPLQRDVLAMGLSRLMTIHGPMPVAIAIAGVLC